ncbi:hypothetical protein ILUMI_11039 [Ignelater luminosus]|uniref:Uncharacterized protein n=1 Tax=Ignelater luminosus TaxID=2038154 RepID=A0A8K0CX00_IGNLU|nr:hypothetical protein ILUMI_11039 [Ignelater luminosus]
MLKLFLNVLLLYSCSFTADAQTSANFLIEDSYTCKDVPNQKINLTIKPKTFSRPQIIDVTLVTPIPLGNQLKFTVIIDLQNKHSARGWQHLVTVDDDLCRARQLYMGPLAYDMETALGVLPRGVCPIPQYVAKVDLENKFSVKNWQHLFTIEDDFCRAMQIYFGRLAYDMETAMGILPRGVCPIPKGNYHAAAENNDVIYTFLGSKCCKGEPNQKINLTIKLKTFSHPQIVDITLITPIPLGNHLKILADIYLENKFITKSWEHLITVEDDFCRIRQLYMGHLAYDMETAMGVIPRGVCSIPKTQIAAYFVLEDSYPCNDVPNRKVNFTIIPKTFSRPQVIDLTVVTPIPLGNQLKFIMNIDLENNIGVKTWQRLVQLEDDFCRAMQLYVGTFLYEVETAMGIQPRGVCPIPKGNYHAVNYTADFSLLKVHEAFPFGKLRTTIKYLEKSSKDIISCIVIIVINKH